MLLVEIICGCERIFECVKRLSISNILHVFPSLSFNDNKVEPAGENVAMVLVGLSSVAFPDESNALRNKSVATVVGFATLSVTMPGFN